MTLGGILLSAYRFHIHTPSLKIYIARLNELYNSVGTEKIKVRTQQLQAKDFFQTSIIR